MVKLPDGSHWDLSGTALLPASWRASNPKGEIGVLSIAGVFFARACAGRKRRLLATVGRLADCKHVSSGVGCLGGCFFSGGCFGGAARAARVGGLRRRRLWWGVRRRPSSVASPVWGGCFCVMFCIVGLSMYRTDYISNQKI